MNTLSEDLRKMADLIDANPELSITVPSRIAFYVGGHTTDFSAAVRAIKRMCGTVDKQSPANEGAPMCAVGKVGTWVQMKALDYQRTQACELVQTGVETVTRDVVKVVGTETVEVPKFEYRCPPILAATG